ALAQEVAVAHDAAEEVVEVVGDAPREAADGLYLLRLEELPLEGLAGGDVRGDAEDLPERAVGGDEGDLDGLEPARARLAGDLLLADDPGLARRHDAAVVGDEGRDLLLVRVEVGIPLPDEALGGRAVDLGAGAVHEGEDAVPVLHED